MDNRVEIIRNSKHVGRNTCSTVNECYSDEELIETLDTLEIQLPKEALEFALMKEGLTFDDTLQTDDGYRVFVEAEDGKHQITTRVVSFEEATRQAEEWLGHKMTSKTRTVSNYGSVVTIEETY